MEKGAGYGRPERAMATLHPLCSKHYFSGLNQDPQTHWSSLFSFLPVLCHPSIHPYLPTVWGA